MKDGKPVIISWGHGSIIMSAIRQKAIAQRRTRCRRRLRGGILADIIVLNLAIQGIAGKADSFIRNGCGHNPDLFIWRSGKKRSGPGHDQQQSRP